jgi:hypothetical protein
MRKAWRSTAALAGLMLGMLLAVPTVAAQAAQPTTRRPAVPSHRKELVRPG